ncbi:MAG: sugar transferase [Lachnospiraceae bacterium]|nr:sugar transferase [Lachnospiraceae bacterium]
MIYAKGIKRFLDILISALIILLLGWLYAALALLVRIKLGSPVLFHQDRPGKDGKIFPMYKFRSMSDERDENGDLLPDEKRLSAFGKKLRASSLDELPELFNILKGDMSLIGPRPLLIRYLPWYTKREFHRHDVRPGLTGLAQINGRNALGWEDRFAYDLTYVEHLTFAMDVRIVLQSIGKVLKRTGSLSGDAQTVADLDAYRKDQVEKGIIDQADLMGEVYE